MFECEQSIHFPKIENIDYKYHTFKFIRLFDDEYQVEKMTIKFNGFEGLTTDFRFKYQSNHKVYVKYHDSTKNVDLTSWLNACEACSPLGIIDKDDIGCLNIKESTTEFRTCYIRRRVKPSVNIYIRFGIPIELIDNIKIGDIKVGF